LLLHKQQPAHQHVVKQNYIYARESMPKTFLLQQFAANCKFLIKVYIKIVEHPEWKKRNKTQDLWK